MRPVRSSAIDSDGSAARPLADGPLRGGATGEARAAFSEESRADHVAEARVIPARLLVLAPNWLGDAVMALPLLRDLRHAWPAMEMVVAARRPVAPLFEMVPGVERTIVLETRGGGRLRGVGADARRLAEAGCEAALLLPNSFLAAWLAWRARVPHRWGYARDLRGRLLTRPIAPPRMYAHHAEYYQALGAALGVVPGPRLASVAVPDAARARARALLDGRGIARDRPFVVIAPGAAYGRAKQWPPERFAELARLLAERGLAAVLVGAARDAEVCRRIAAASPAVDLSGRTDLAELAALASGAHAVVANDSGAMHLAAAAGARVVAIFGPTDERRTAPLPARAGAPPAVIVTTDVWCRPCLLRECPIDHRCMTRISAARVLAHIAPES